MEGGNMDEQLEKNCEDIFKRLKELEESKEWVANGDKPCLKFKIEIGNRMASKGIHVVDYGIAKVFEFLDKEESLAQMNPQVIEMKVLHAKKDVFRVNYQQYKGMWPVANRDFVSVGASFKESDSKIYIGTKACKYPHPEVKGVVRGEIFIGGYIIEKVDEDHSKVTYISDADLAGSIPSLIKNQLAQKQGDVASKVGYIMKKTGC